MIRDPITLWVAETLNEHPQISLNKLLQDSLDRTYSASPYEGFFTGGGLHTFNNFDSKDNDRRMSIREATRRSTNLVFIRLMRDLVRFHQSRLPYDSELVLSDHQNPLRYWLLNEAADEEAKQILLRAFKSYRELSPEGITTHYWGGGTKTIAGWRFSFLHGIQALVKTRNHPFPLGFSPREWMFRPRKFRPSSTPLAVHV